MQTKDYINIIYEDKDLLACEKPPAILTLPSESAEKSLIDFLGEYYREKGDRIELFPLHRLDRLT
ncbi:MAG: RluA family pseudouridine synthase, partial [Clostridia bacterium]|nr:RluA family pseudouridine synthase [Clostridia bacterium]